LRHLCSAILAEAVAAVALLGEARAVAELVVALVVAHAALVSAEAAKEAGEAARAMVVAARGTEVVATARVMAAVATALGAVATGTVAAVTAMEIKQLLAEGMARGGRSKWGSWRARQPAARVCTMGC